MTIKRPVVIRGGELRAETKRQSTGDFQGSDSDLYDIIMVNTSHYNICPKPLKV